VSPSHVAALIEYIINQEEHHRRERFKMSFAGYARSMVWRLMSATYGIDRVMCNAFSVIALV
jgi:hypothetical protein